MEIKVWMIWMIFAAIMIIGEIFTVGFFILWFGIGAIVAGILAILGTGAVPQWTAFVLVSGVLLVGSRRFANKITKPQPPGIGADRFVGKTGMVLEQIDNMKNTGRVRLGAEEWRAQSETEEIIPPESQVLVVQTSGTHLIVKTVKGE